MSPSAFRSSNVYRGIVLVLLTVMLFTVMDTVSKYLSRYYPVSMILWTRYLFHTLLFVVTLGPRLKFDLVRTSRPWIQILRGALLFCAAFCFVSAVKLMPLAETTAICFLNPVLTTLLAVAFLNEKVETGRWVAICCSFAAVLLIIRPGSHFFTWAVVFPLANAVFFAVYQVMTRRLAGLESSFTLIFYPGLVGLALCSLMLPQFWTMPQSIEHLLLLALAGCISGASHLILIKAFALAPASRLAPFSYFQLIWVTLAGYLVFDNFPDHWSLLGIGILLVSGIYSASYQRLSGKDAQRSVPDIPASD